MWVWFELIRCRIGNDVAGINNDKGRYVVYMRKYNYAEKWEMNWQVMRKSSQIL
jgi:hypothetical protein